MHKTIAFLLQTIDLMLQKLLLGPGSANGLRVGPAEAGEFVTERNILVFE
jgi:hypothetical protein